MKSKNGYLFYVVFSASFFLVACQSGPNGSQSAVGGHYKRGNWLWRPVQTMHPLNSKPC